MGVAEGSVATAGHSHTEPESGSDLNLLVQQIQRFLLIIPDIGSGDITN